jgi:quercetin dioxygenase-like cupin family protein
MSAVHSATLPLLALFTLSGCTVHHHYPSAPPSEAREVEEDQTAECAPLLPAPEALKNTEGPPNAAPPSHAAPPPHAHSHSHSHFHAQKDAFAHEAASAKAAEAHIIPHAELTKFENQGTILVGLATQSLGAQNFEIWRSSIPPGGKTPLHVHDTEETFILLRGKGKLLVGDTAVEFEAPATVIAPAHVPHQLVNTGDVATDQIVVVGLGSEIKNDEGKVMDLPWRK